MKNLLLRGSLFMLVLALVLELFFHLVMPANTWPRWVVQDNGIRKFDPGYNASGKATYGRYCRGGFTWKINGQGWNSLYEYRRPDQQDKPVVALLGDSYLEGFFSDVDEHIDVFLTEALGDRAEVYTFGMSGAFLSQYLALLEQEVTPGFDPDVLVVFVNHHDVAHSIRQLGGRHPYYWQYDRAEDGSYTSRKPRPFGRSGIKDFLLKSATIRYLKANAQVKLFGKGVADDNANFEGDSPRNEQPKPELLAAARFLLGELASFGKPVLMVGDCPRNWIYEGSEPESFVDVVALREVAGEFPGITFIDLQPFYLAEYRRSGERFSPEDNTHWNARANAFVARLIAPTVRQLLGEG